MNSELKTDKYKLTVSLVDAKTPNADSFPDSIDLILTESTAGSILYSFPKAVDAYFNSRGSLSRDHYFVVSYGLTKYEE